MSNIESNANKQKYEVRIKIENIKNLYIICRFHNYHVKVIPKNHVNSIA